MVSQPRQLHRCYVGCFVTISFNDTVTMPTHCNVGETDLGCEITATLNYADQSIFMYSYRIAENLTIDNITYESTTSHVADFKFDADTTRHLVKYVCALDDFCEWEYIIQIIPNLITLNYQPLYDSLLPEVSNINGHPAVTECFNNTELVNCSLGTCQFFQTIDNDYKLSTTRRCSILEERFVEAGKVRHLPGPSEHDYDIVTFTCDLNQCNDEINEYEIKQIIVTEGNEYITTSTTITSSSSTSTTTTIISSTITTTTTTTTTSSHSSHTQFQFINLIFCYWCFILIKY